MVYEGFWDVYCKKPASPDLNFRKLEGWITRIHLLNVGPAIEEVSGEKEGEEETKEEAEEDQPEEEQKNDETIVEGEGEEEQQEQEPAGPVFDVKAVVRIRVPLKREPTPELAEGVEDEAAGQEPTSAPKKSEQDKPLEEQDCEDRVMAVNPQGENYNVLVVHQLAQRVLREHIAKSFKEYLQTELQLIEEEELLQTVEKDSEKFELDFFNCFLPETPLFDFEKN